MRPLTHALPGALRHLLRDAPLSDGKIRFAWSAAVGPAVTRATQVKLESGVLIVEATGAEWTRELTRSRAVILKRLEALLGDDTVTRIDIRLTPI